MGCLFWFFVIFALFTGGFKLAFTVFICLLVFKAIMGF